MSASELAQTKPITLLSGKPLPLSSLINTDGARPNRWAMMKSGLKRAVMSRTCAPISRPGAGTAKVRISKPSALARSSRIGNGSLPAGLS